MKIDIVECPKAGEPIYANLTPLLEALVSNGNRVVSEPNWRTDQGGWYATLDKPIDFGLIKNNFNLPSAVILEEDRDRIFCSCTWTYIRGGLHWVKP